MAMYGYARVSSTDQNTGIQEVALRQAGCDIIRSENVSGASRSGRRELETLLEFIRSGDTLVVTRIDRLARSLGDLQDILRALKSRGASLKVIEQPVDTGTPAGKAFIDMLGVFAEFETSLRKERQMEGIRTAKARGVYKGRPPKLEAAAINAALKEGLSPTVVAKHLGISRTSVYRLGDKHGSLR
ncbi:recombinase family protein [Labrys neptuniae]